MLTSWPWARLILLYLTLGCGCVRSQAPPSPTLSPSSPASSSSPLAPLSLLPPYSSSSSSMSPSSSSFSPPPSSLSSLSPSPSLSPLSSSLSPSSSSLSSSSLLAPSLSSSSLAPSWSLPSWSRPSWSRPSWSPPSWSPSPSSWSPPPSRSPPASSWSPPPSRCGCWGKNKVYLQYKAPATGWYTASPASRHLYERNLNISGRKVQYVLEYKNRLSPAYWMLFENRPDGATKVISNRKEKMLVSCPSRCSCRKVSVTGTCWAISGNYTRNGTPEDSLALIERAMRAEQSAPKNKTKSLSVLEQSNCLLAELAKCIESEDETNGQSSIPQEDSTTTVEDGCHQHIQVLTDTSQHGSGIPLSDTRHQEAYIKEGTKIYFLKQADEEDFWWIVDDTDVYAMSEDAGPCPDQLPTDCKWISVEDMKIDPNISVTCVAWDTPGGD